LKQVQSAPAATQALKAVMYADVVVSHSSARLVFNPTMLSFEQSAEAVVLHLHNFSTASLTLPGTGPPSHSVPLFVAAMMAMHAFSKVVKAFSFLLSIFLTQPSILFACLSRFWFLLKSLKMLGKQSLFLADLYFCLFVCFLSFFICFFFGFLALSSFLSSSLFLFLSFRFFILSFVVGILNFTL